MTTHDNVVSVIPVAGAAAEPLVAILHDAEEDDERIRAAIGDPTCSTYTALVDDRPVGAAVVRWSTSEPSEILYLAVTAADRGKGYGRQIVAALQTELPEHGRMLLVGTANSALDNIAFYQKCGFRMHAVKPDYFAYIQPPIRENGIPMRDMIVFSYHLDAEGQSNAIESAG
jgi:GNAT superfamily N-acetyltransferase